MNAKEFGEKYPSREEKEEALKQMTDEEIDELIESQDNIYGKIFYSKFKSQRQTAFSGPTIGIIHPKGSTIKKNPDGRITIVPPRKNDEKEIK